MINEVLTAATVAGVGATLSFMYKKSKNEIKDVSEELMDFEKLFEVVKTSITDIIKEETSLGMTRQEFLNSEKRKARINSALKYCVEGRDRDKLIVLDLIKNILRDLLPTEEAINNVIKLDSTALEPRIKFEILLYKLKKTEKKNALAHMIKKYKLDKEKFIIEDRSMSTYCIDDTDINFVYNNEHSKLEYAEKLDVLSILLYQRYKGFGIVDTINEMNINGFNFGTSGSIIEDVNNKRAEGHSFKKSVWLYFEGKYIHLRFLEFSSEDEMRRVVQLIGRYNNPGPLTEKKGFLVNTMADKSRVLATRPSLSEGWAVFVRKFSLSDPSLRGLICKDYVSNGDMAVKMIYYLMRGQRTTAFTGRQGSGKTTMMAGAIEAINPRYNIRVVEMAPELYLREIYPERNILSLQETPTVTATMAQDALKKSDAAVTLVGEVATDEIAANMIQAAQIASLFTIFSHHANTADDLVYGIRNSLVNAKGYDMKTAEDQVLSVINHNIHLDYTTDGKRFIERYTEIVPLAERMEYPTLQEASMEEITAEYYKRKTDRVKFETRDIMRFNIEKGCYEFVNKPTDKTINEMMSVMSETDKKSFESFLDNWKI